MRARGLQVETVYFDFASGLGSSEPAYLCMENMMGKISCFRYERKKRRGVGQYLNHRSARHGPLYLSELHRKKNATKAVT